MKCQYIFIQQNAFQNVVWKMAAILFLRRHFKRLFLNENARISIEISLKFVTKGRIDKTALV